MWVYFFFGGGGVKTPPSCTYTVHSNNRGFIQSHKSIPKRIKYITNMAVGTRGSDERFCKRLFKRIFCNSLKLRIRHRVSSKKPLIKVWFIVQNFLARVHCFEFILFSPIISRGRKLHSNWPQPTACKTR